MKVAWAAGESIRVCFPFMQIGLKRDDQASLARGFAGFHDHLKLLANEGVINPYEMD